MCSQPSRMTSAVALGAVVVALHDDGPANRDLADHVPEPSSAGLGSTILASMPGSGLPTEPITLRSRRRDRGSAGGLGEPVGLQDVETEGMEITPDRRRRSGSRR